MQLRKAGLSYSEILKQIPVAKSTLSIWLRSVGLAKAQKQRITEKRLAAAARGGRAKHLQRLARVDKIYEESSMELGEISERELWLMGIMLYWAEGAKEKEYSPGSSVKFTNSDPRMIQLFIKWLKMVAGMKDKDITPSLTIHETKKENLSNIIKEWSAWTGIPESEFKVYFKKSKPTNRRNVGRLYFGVLEIRVRKSSRLNRKISAWTQEVCRQWGVV